MSNFNIKINNVYEILVDENELYQKVLLSKFSQHEASVFGFRFLVFNISYFPAMYRFGIHELIKRDVLLQLWKFCE